MNQVETFSDLGGAVLSCPDAVPTVLGLFDPAIAPPLLYYSYIPITVISLLFGYTVIVAGRQHPAARFLLWIAVTFSLLLMGETFLWIGVSAPMIHFVWQTIIIFHAVLSFLLINFTYAFVTQRNMPFAWQWAALVLLAPIFIFAPTEFNLSAFDLVNCESVQGPLWIYMYALEATALISALFLCIRKGKQTQDRGERTKLLTLGGGIMVFFGIFILSNAFGDLTLVYNINLFGPLGMVTFLGVIMFLIVRYQAFQMKVLGAQALVWALVALIFAALFVRPEYVSYVLIGTLGFVVVLGILLIRNVKLEVKQREQIQHLASGLAEANEGQVALLHFITHQIKGFLTKSRYIFGELEAGSYGALAPKVKDLVSQGYHFSTDAVATVQNILHAASVRTGKVAYKHEPLDFQVVVETEVEKQRKVAERKGLTLTFSSAAGDYSMEGDTEQLVHAVANLIDNAIKYTPKGSVEVALARTDGIIRLSVKDSGVGIPERDKEKLFKEGGRGEHSQAVNTDSTGYGLYIVKGIIEAHGGKVWYESEGENKGTTFVVEVGAVKQ